MKKQNIFLALIFISFTLQLSAYPIDAFLKTGIRRLIYLTKKENDELRGKKLPAGALKDYDEIQLNLYTPEAYQFPVLPEVDEELDKELDKLFPNRHSSYSVSLMDISPGKPIRYAVRKGDRGYQPGSVGKLAVLTAFFCELSNIYPDDFEKRIELLKNTDVLAGSWALYDHHTITDYDGEKERAVRRRVNAKDVFTLYEWLDYMLSVSNNGAASIVWREALLMREFGEDYPNLTQEQRDEYFKNANRRWLSDVAENVVNEPLRALDIGHDEWRLGTFFTRGASSIVPPQGGSIGTTEGLMKWLFALEKGDIVDKESSLEMKRLLYMTDRRIRYASNKILNESAVYFKSGSLYKCNRELKPNCGKYAGNVYNYMNSVAIVERPDDVIYMVALMTNVKNRNSAWDHNRLAGDINKLFPERDTIAEWARVETPIEKDTLPLTESELYGEDDEEDNEDTN